MSKKTSFCLLSLVLGAAFFGAACRPPTASSPGDSMPIAAPQKPGTIEIFTSESCPHCQAIKQEIKDKSWDKTLPLAMKPLDGDRTNQQLALEHAAVCRLPKDNIQVPFLWDGQRCLVGQEKISAYLTGLSEKHETPTSTSR